MNNPAQHKTGGDPRLLPDYVALCDELAKLSHPARPDIDWHRVVQLSGVLFRHNGVELQTACWYTLARARTAGIAGLNDGLAILSALLRYQWQVFWPLSAHARADILAGFSQRLQSALRTLVLNNGDLAQVYLAGQQLNRIRDILQQQESGSARQLEALCAFMHNAALRLENATPGHLPPALSDTVAEVAEGMYVERPVYTGSGRYCEPPAAVPPMVRAALQPSLHPGRRFILGVVMGVVTGVVVGIASVMVPGGAGGWGWPSSPSGADRALPVNASEQALNRLQALPPLWRHTYGFALIARADPGEADRLRAQWQDYIHGNALPPEALSGWHQGMEGLQEMARRLNTLDERKGKYLTGSELKSMVFTITQHFSRAVPVEERLYQLSHAGRDAPLAAQQLQLDIYLDQLLNRYMLIQQQINEGA